MEQDSQIFTSCWKTTEIHTPLNNADRQRWSTQFSTLQPKTKWKCVDGMHKTITVISSKPWFKNKLSHDARRPDVQQCNQKQQRQTKETIFTRVRYVTNKTPKYTPTITTFCERHINSQTQQYDEGIVFGCRMLQMLDRSKALPPHRHPNMGVHVGIDLQVDVQIATHLRSITGALHFLCNVAVEKSIPLFEHVAALWKNSWESLKTFSQTCQNTSWK